MKLPDIGYVVSLTLFFVFCGLSISGSRNSSELSKLGIESISPENLRGSANSFKLSLAVEKHSKTIEDISESESWLELESKLSAYANRLELLRDQQRSQQRVIRWLYLASAISMLIFTIMRGRAKRNKAEQDSAPNPPCSPVLM